MCLNSIFSQIAEPEKKLRDARKDTINGWQYGGVVMMNFGQTALSNWAAGGENSISGNSFFNFFANYRKNSLTWDNTIDLGYGLLRQNDQNRKTDDKIDFSTKVGMAASKNWYYSGLLNFRSQFTSGYKYPNDTTRIKVSNFFAPAYIVTAIGMDYKPGKTFTAFIAPLTGKITIVADQKLADAGAFGVEPAKFQEEVMIEEGERIRKEFGGYCKVAFQKEIMTNVNLSSKIDLFSNYLDKPQNIDVNWQVLVSMKVNKFISASLSTQLIYDDDIKYKNKITKKEEGPKVQFKEILGIGFSYKFSKNGK
jgi:hypothetical protein